MPINAGYEYFNAEKRYLDAQNLEERIVALEEMIKVAPKHKGSENLLAELKTRLKKFKQKSERVKKSGGGKKGIKKEGYQAVLIGLANSGKSSLLAALTNAHPEISSHPFATKEPEIGTMNYHGVRAQIVDMPSFGSSFFDIGLVNTADCIVEVASTLDDFSSIEQGITRAYGKRLRVIMKVDLFSNEERRKMEERCKSKRLFTLFVSAQTGDGIEELKKAIFDSMNVIRVYTKEPGKVSSGIPVLLPHESAVRDVAESILKGFSSRVRETRVTGPSAKFINQKVGLNHKLKDRDVVEFHTN